MAQSVQKSAANLAGPDRCWEQVLSALRYTIAVLRSLRGNRAERYQPGRFDQGPAQAIL